MTNTSQQTPKEVRRKRGLDRQAEIYRRALDLLIQKGYASTSMSMIADSLGMSKANLYHYCSSKEDLLYRIHLDHLAKHYVPFLEEAERLPDPKERIALFLRKLTLLHTSSKAGRVLLQEIQSLNGNHHNEITLIWRRAYDLIRDAVKELQQSGKARKMRGSFLAFLGLGMANWIPNWFDYSRQSNAEELADTLIEIFLKGLLNP
jgi:AcrR family transcriptional regulator